MKHIYISLDELNDTLERLWEKCEDNGCSFRVVPSKRKIEVFKVESSLSSHQLAEIEVINITDAYDAISEIFNEK